MTEQDKAEIRKIIKEEIDAKFARKINISPIREVNNSAPDKVKKTVEIETVSPAY
jgi:hypothetical protein